MLCKAGWPLNIFGYIKQYDGQSLIYESLLSIIYFCVSLSNWLLWPHLVFTSCYPSLLPYDLLNSPPPICQLVKRTKQNQTGAVTLVLFLLWSEGIILHLILHGNQYIIPFQSLSFVGLWIKNSPFCYLLLCCYVRLDSTSHYYRYFLTCRLLLTFSSNILACPCQWWNMEAQRGWRVATWIHCNNSARSFQVKHVDFWDIKAQSLWESWWSLQWWFSFQICYSPWIQQVEGWCLLVHAWVFLIVMVLFLGILMFF